jgi:hypothetical protein
VNEYAFVGRLAFTSILLTYAAWRDLSKREVENWVPIALVAGGVCFAAYDAVFLGDPLPVVLALVTAAVSFGIALAIFYAGSMGGADCKIFIGVSTVFPLLITSPLPLLSEVNPFFSGSRRILPFFSLSWLINSLLISLAVPVGLLLRNLVDLLRGRIPKVTRRTIPAFFVGYRARVDSLRSSFLIPLERFEEVDGKEVRVLRYSRGVLEEEEEVELIERVRERLRGDELIWAFPYIPFIVPMLIALFVTVLFGDLLVNLASRL